MNKELVKVRTLRHRLYTKSALAKKIKKSPTHINDLIKRGELEEIEINGLKIVYYPN
jgi:hypothetical protein